MGKPNTLDDIFAQFVLMPNGCLEWQGRRDDGGYGRVGFLGEEWSTHRLMWTIKFGSIPDGQIICHKCDNPPCGKIAHLFLGTNEINMLDASWKGRGSHRPERITGPLPVAIPNLGLRGSYPVPYTADDRPVVERHSQVPEPYIGKSKSIRGSMPTPIKRDSP